MSEYIGASYLNVMDHALNYNKHLLDIIISNAQPNDQILDFGAGIGTFTIPLANMGNNICSIEPDPKQLLFITKQGIPGYTDIANIPDNSLDYVFTINVLEHIKDDQIALLDLSNKLRTGGRLLIYVPAFQVLFSQMDKSVGHFRRYSMKELSSKIAAAGFIIIETRYADSLGFFATLLYKYIEHTNRPLDARAVIVFDRFIFPISLLLDKVTHKLFGKNIIAVAEKC